MKIYLQVFAQNVLIVIPFCGGRGTCMGAFGTLQTGFSRNRCCFFALKGKNEILLLWKSCFKKETRQTDLNVPTVWRATIVDDHKIN